MTQAKNDSPNLIVKGAFGGSQQIDLDTNRKDPYIRGILDAQKIFTLPTTPIGWVSESGLWMLGSYIYSRITVALVGVVVKGAIIAGSPSTVIGFGVAAGLITICLAVYIIWCIMHCEDANINLTYRSFLVAIGIALQAIALF